MLNTFESLTHAAAHLGVSFRGGGSIGGCIRGITKTAYGYRWEEVRRPKEDTDSEACKQFGEE